MANRFLSNISINDAYTLPASDGTSGQVITTDGSGNLSFSDVTFADGARSNFVYYDVKNSSGSTINKGTAVMAVGTDGNSGHVLIAPMVADGSVEPRYFMGVLETTLLNGETGKVVHFGQISQLNTTAFADGDILWCDPANAGGFTVTEPLGPNVKIAAAIVISSATNGKIKVRVQGNAGLHELHDVKLVSEVNGDLLQWNGTTGVWENKSLATIADSRYVNVSGDTMTGDLNVSSGNILIGTQSGSAFNGSSKLKIQPPTGAAYIQIKTANTEQVGLLFGDVDDNFVGGFVYANVNDKLLIYTNNSANVAIDNLGQVGIGITNPNRKLHLTGGDFYTADRSDTAGASVGYGGNSFQIRNGSTSEDLNFDVFNRTTSAWYTPMIVKNTGNVGIGTNTPNAKLEVNGGTITRGLTNIINAMGVAGEFSSCQAILTTTNSVDTTGWQGIAFETSTSANYGWSIGANRSSSGRGSFRFYEHVDSEAGAERFTLLQDGNVGIGSADPVGKLEVNTGPGGAYFTRTAGDKGVLSPTFGILTDSTSPRLYSYGDAMKFYTSAVGGTPSERMRLDDSGNLGIGVTLPNTKLEVNGVITATDGNSTNWNTAYTYSQVGHLPLAGGTLTGDLGVGITPVGRFHVYHPSTNVVARFESGDSIVHVNLKDNASDTYGILLSATGNDFHISTGVAVGGALTERFRISGSTGVITADGGTSTNWNTAYNYSTVGHLPLAGGVVSGNLQVNGTNGAVAFVVNSTHTPSVNANRYGAQINFDISDAGAALTADRVYAALDINATSNVSGGDLSNEARIYGINTNVIATSDEDLALGILGVAGRQAGVGQTANTSVMGVEGVAYTNAGVTNAEVVTELIGLYGYAYASNSDGTNPNVITSYGVLGKYLNVSGGLGAVVTAAYGGYFEVENDIGTIQNAYGVRAVIDRDGGTTQNGYLFYGDFQGTIAGNKYGLWIAGETNNYLSGNVGIGVTSPTTKLDVNGVITATGGNSTEWNTAFDWGDHDGLYLPLTGGSLTGSLGIGTAGPQAPLHIIAASTDDDALIQEWSYNSTDVDKYSLMLKQTVTSGVVRYNFSMVNNNTAYNDTLVLDRGNVGIGTTAPSRKLEVSGNAYVAGEFLATTNGLVRLDQYDNGLNGAGEISLWSATGTGWNIGDGLGRIRFYLNDASSPGVRDVAKIEAVSENGNGTPTSTASAALAFYTSAFAENIVENMRLSSTGNLSVVGTINADSGVVLLGQNKIDGSSGNLKISSDYNSVSGSSTIEFLIDGSEKVRIDNSGNIFIGGTSNTSVPVLNKGVYLQSQTEGDIIGYSLYSNESSNNRRASFFLDDTNGVHGIDTTFSAGPGSEFIIRRAGVEQFRIDNYGNLGIGVTPYTNTLGSSKGIDIIGNGGLFGYNNSTYITANSHYGSTWTYKTTNPAGVLLVSDTLTFRSAASGTGGEGITFTERFRIATDGNVGIGTTDPRFQLDLAKQNNSSQSDYIALGVTNGPTTGDGTNLGSGVIWKANFSGYTKRSAGIVQIAEGSYFRSGLAFYTNGTANTSTDWVEAMRISKDQNVGIGTTSPSSKLDIEEAVDRVMNTSGTGQFEIQGNGYTFGIAMGAATTALYHNSSSRNLSFGTNETERLTITGGGNVGIGETSPEGLLHISSSTSGDAIVIIEADTDNNNEGDIPQLWFRGDGGINGGAILYDDNELHLISNVSSSNAILFSVGSTNNYGLNSPTTGAVERMRIDSTGFVVIKNNAGLTGASLTLANDDTGIDIDQSVGYLNFYSNDTSTTSLGGVGGIAVKAETAFNTSRTPSYMAFYTHDDTPNDGTLLGNVSERMRIEASGAVGIGTSSPMSWLHIAPPDPSTDFNIIDFRNTGGYGIYAKTNSIPSRGQTLEFMAVDYNLGGTVITREALCLRPEGNVGIGVPNPVSKLQVAGDILPSADNTGVIGNTDYTWANGEFTNLSVNSTLTVVSTLNVRSAIDLADSDILRFGSSDDFKMYYDGAANEMEFEMEATCNQIRIHDNGTTRFLFTRSTGQFEAKGDIIGKKIFGLDAADFTRIALNPDGDSYITGGFLGIGDTSPSYELDVNGTIRATGDVIAYSDRRKKENIATIDNALDIVQNMRGVFYNKIDEDDRKVGVIAQEVLEVLPEAVSYAEDKDEYGVAYGNIVGVLIEAIKDQQKQIDELKAMINGSSK